MEKEGLCISRHPSLIGMLFLALFVSSCSAPRIIILKDPLTATEHNDLGVVYEQKGMLDLAEKEYFKALEKENDWWLPYFNLGNLFYKKGDLMIAEIYYRRALDYDSTNTDIMNNLANLLHERSRETEAVELITKALCAERKPEYLDTYRKLMGTPKEDAEAPMPSPSN